MPWRKGTSLGHQLRLGRRPVPTFFYFYYFFYSSNQDPRNQELGPSRHHDSVRHTLQPCNLALYVLLLRLLPHPHLSYFRTSKHSSGPPHGSAVKTRPTLFLLPSLKGHPRPPLERPGPQSAFTFYKKQL